MWRWEVLDYIAKRFNYQKYLEIGVDQNHTFKFLDIGHMVGVDPNINTTHRMTSDAFFKKNKETFDLVFIDGLHERDQVLRDVENSLKILEPGGTIVCHDCNPREKFRLGPMWSGNVWEAIVHLMASRSDLEIWTIDEDTGMTVIRPGHRDPLRLMKFGLLDMTFEFLDRHRRELLNLVSFEEFQKILDND